MKHKLSLDILYPDAWISSTYKIPFEKLYRKGYRGVIFDIDNTLVPHGAPADERAEDLFVRLNELGFEYALISNNKGPRVQMFMHTQYVTHINQIRNLI